MDKIVCFGKNYRDHQEELGDKPVDKPVIFLKPPSVLQQCMSWDEKLNLSLTPEETHYECELVIKLKKGGYQLSLQAASAAIGWYSVGLDMTLRKLQRQLKDAGHPWTTAKVFKDAAVVGPWIENKNESYKSNRISFTLNNVEKQSENIDKMLFSPPELIVYASQFFPLCEGDVLFTGTPAGVGQVNANSTGILKLENYQYFVHWT